MAAVQSRKGHAGVRPPRLNLDWQSARSTVFSNLRTVLGGPKAPKIASGGQYFPGILVLPGVPVRALAASVLWHIVFFYFPLPNLPRGTNRPQLAAPRIEVTWYAPPPNLTPLVAPPLLGKRIAPSPANKRLPPRAADAFHPRQTILSLPKQPTHPRQTLIQPEAPPVPPKILPPLPNIVQWSEPPLSRKPWLTFRPPSSAKLRPNPLPSRPPADVPAPAVPNEEKTTGEFSIASSVLANSQPRLAVPAMSVQAPQAGPQTASDATAAPDIGRGSDADVRRVIALSATPAPPAPVIEVPPGNLQARIAISPEGASPAEPGGTEGSSGGGPGAKTGPPEISINGARAEGSMPVAGPSGPPGARLPARPAGGPDGQARAGIGLGKEVLAMPLPAKPVPRLVPPDPGRTRPAPAFDRIKPGAPPESILSPKRVYTLHVNMPNLASATGSWVLNFAELEENDPGAGKGLLGPVRAKDAVDLVGPVPLRKVDPRYPPALVSARVQGEVVLYAIIRKDGAVDSIQLVRGVEPELDRNAMEALSRWKFRPAQKNGESVELEAVIHVPFRFVLPF